MSEPPSDHDTGATPAAAPARERAADDQHIEALLARARAGEQDALAELFRVSGVVLDSLAERERSRRRWRPGLERASDIAQETALSAFSKFGSFRGATAAEWRAWLKTIFGNRRDGGLRSARRLKRDVGATRRLDSEHAATLVATQRTASQAVAHEQSWRQTLGFIYELPADQSRAIWLCHLEELPVAEAALAMDKSEAAVAGLLRRGLATLRARAGSEDPAGAEGAGTEAAASALLAYLRQRDAGAAIDREALLAEHAACADELASMLAWIDHIEHIRPRREDD